MSYQFNDEYVSITVTEVENLRIKITGNIKNMTNYSKMELIAPNSILKGMSYQGSGLPFPNPTVAFDDTVNFHTIPENGVIHDVIFAYPNGYYVVGGSTKIPPSIFVVLYPKNIVKNIFRINNLF